jgi:hypothetical protein
MAKMHELTQLDVGSTFALPANQPGRGRPHLRWVFSPLAVKWRFLKILLAISVRDPKYPDNRSGPIVDSREELEQ